jgi:hypothetical protein
VKNQPRVAIRLRAVANLIRPPASKVAGVKNVRGRKQGGTTMQETKPQLKRPSYRQLIFLQSKVNNGRYNGEALPSQSWDWPKDTYFQRRLNLIKFLSTPEALIIRFSAKNFAAFHSVETAHLIDNQTDFYLMNRSVDQFKPPHLHLRG